MELQTLTRTEKKALLARKEVSQYTVNVIKMYPMYNHILLLKLDYIRYGMLMFPYSEPNPKNYIKCIVESSTHGLYLVVTNDNGELSGVLVKEESMTTNCRRDFKFSIIHKDEADVWIELLQVARYQ